MKTKLFTFLIMFCSAIMYSQNESTNFEVGDVFTIAEVEHNDYNHINFPRANFIIKKGGLPHYKNIKGAEVEVTSLREKKSGAVVATLQLSSKKSFFNSHKYVTVDLEKALRENELVQLY